MARSKVIKYDIHHYLVWYFSKHGTMHRLSKQIWHWYLVYLLIFFPLWFCFNAHIMQHRVGVHFFLSMVVQKENALRSIAQDDEMKMIFQVFQLGTLVCIFLLIGKLLVFCILRV